MLLKLENSMAPQRSQQACSNSAILGQKIVSQKT